MCEIERKRGGGVERGKEITKKKERNRRRNSVEEGKSEIEERKCDTKLQRKRLINCHGPIYGKKCFENNRIEAKKKKKKKEWR